MSTSRLQLRSGLRRRLSPRRRHRVPQRVRDLRGRGIVLRRVLNRLRSEERGFALVMALMAMTVLTIVTTTAIYLLDAERSTQSQLLEVVRRRLPPGRGRHQQRDGDARLPPDERAGQATLAVRPRRPRTRRRTRPVRRSGGARFDSVSETWTRLRQGRRHEPEPDSAAITRPAERDASGSRPSYDAATQHAGVELLFATNQGGSNVCDVQPRNNVEIDSPVLRRWATSAFDNNAKIVEDLATPRLPIIVIVQGKFQYANGTSIGRMQHEPRRPTAHINGGCGASLRACTRARPTRRLVGYDPTLRDDRSTPAAPTVSPPVSTGADWYYATRARARRTRATTSVGRRCPLLREHAARRQQHAAGHLCGTTRTAASRRRSEPDAVAATTPAQTRPGRSVVERHDEGVDGQAASIYIDGSVDVSERRASTSTTVMATLYLSGTLTVDGMMCGKRQRGQLPTATSRTGTRTPRC